LRSLISARRESIGHLVDRREYDREHPDIHCKLICGNSDIGTAEPVLGAKDKLSTPLQLPW
jgi:hypothetical protein